MGHMSGDYYSRQMGFVIENQIFRDEERAKRYMMRTCYMSEEESTTYLNRLRIAYMQHIRAAKTSMEEKENASTVAYSV